MGKTACSTGIVSKMMKASDGFGTMWMTDLVIILSTKAIFQMIGERVPWDVCTRGNVTQVHVVHTEGASESVGTEGQMSGVNSWFHAWQGNY